MRAGASGYVAAEQLLVFADDIAQFAHPRLDRQGVVGVQPERRTRVADEVVAAEPAFEAAVDRQQQARARDDWNPNTPYKVTIFDDFGRLQTVDFKPQGSTLSAQEQAWFNGEIIKAQNVGRTSDWLSQASGKGIEKRLEIGRALNAMSMSLSQVVTSMVRMGEHAAREKEVLQQSAQGVQKGLGDEVGQKDSADAALLQKLMDVLMQLFQSRIDVISKMA